MSFWNLPLLSLPPLMEDLSRACQGTHRLVSITFIANSQQQQIVSLPSPFSHLWYIYFLFVG